MEKELNYEMVELISFVAIWNFIMNTNTIPYDSFAQILYILIYMQMIFMFV